MNAYLAARNPTNNQVTIYAEYANSGRIKRVPTGVKVNPKYFDKKTGLVRAYGGASVESTNKQLKSVLAGLNDTITSLYIANGNILPTINQLNAHLSGKAETIAVEATPETPLLTELLSFIERQYETADWKEATKKGFITLTNNIRAYQTATNTTWLLSKLTNEDVEKWQKFLLKEYDYNNATLGKRVRLFRQFLRAKQPQHINLNLLKPIHKEMLMEPVVLYKSEIEALAELDLSQNVRLERVRDLQQLQIFTGLRFSDLMLLRSHHIKNNFIKIRAKKTEMPVEVPLFNPAAAIIKKYTNPETNELELPVISNQKFNEYLKELCALVPALQLPVKIEQKKRKEIITTFPQKFTLISSHSSRRSFVTLCLELNFKPNQVMKWSGHRTLAAFNRYIGKNEENIDIASIFDTAYNSK